MNRKGFTLIELLAVIVVIALVIGLSTFGIIKVYNNSKEKSLKIAINSILEVARTYADEKSTEEIRWTTTKETGDSYTYFCTSVKELVNNGMLKKEKVSNYINDYVIVKKNRITFTIDDLRMLDNDELESDPEANSACERMKDDFKEKETLVEYITNLYNTNKNTTVTNNNIEYQYATSVNLMNDRLGGTTSLDGGNIRYYGASPSNYIDIGDRTTNNEVILWRIIGVFDGKVRVVRYNSIGNYSWATSASDVNYGYGRDVTWDESDLVKLLNPGYDSESVGGSLYWNSDNGLCYNWTSNKTTTCNFTSTGLSDEAKENIIDQEIYLSSLQPEQIHANEAYLLERNNTEEYQNPQNKKMTAKVALIYPSDYSYSRDLSVCPDLIGNNYSNECKNSTWITSKKDIWTVCRNGKINTNTSVPLALRMVDSSGNIAGNHVAYAYGIYPVLTLYPDLLLKSGEGKRNNPYVIE